jgi:hypothetical protein
MWHHFFRKREKICVTLTTIAPLSRCPCPSVRHAMVCALIRSRARQHPAPPRPGSVPATRLAVLGLIIRTDSRGAAHNGELRAWTLAPSRMGLRGAESTIGRVVHARPRSALRLDGHRYASDAYGIRTPLAAPDACGGWWVSVYSEPALALVRGSPAELKDITTGPAKDASSAAADWTADDMKQARKPAADDGGAQPGGAPASHDHGPVYVRGYVRKDGKYVAPYTRSSPGAGSRRR